MATLINLSNTTPAAAAGGQNVLWQSDASSPTNVSAYIDFSNVLVPIIVKGPGTNGATLQTTLLATAISTNQPSPTLIFSGQTWDSIGLVSHTNLFTIQETNGALTFTNVGASAVFPYSFDSGVAMVGLQLNGAQSVSFITGGAGASFPLTAAGNAAAGLTTYTGTIGAGSGPGLGMNATISGFTTPANNGTFVVHDSTPTTVTVYNAAGVAETHAGTLTTDNDYFNNNGGYGVVIGPIASTFSIKGTAYTTLISSQPYVAYPAYVFTAKGDAADAGYLRIINDGPTASHGVEMGAIVDGTGATPVTISFGVFNGGDSVLLSHLLYAPNTVVTSATPTTTSGQVGFGTSSGFGAGSAGTGVTTTTKGGGTGPTTAQTIVKYLEIDIAGTKYWIPLMQ